MYPELGGITEGRGLTRNPIKIDDDLLAKAAKLTGPLDRSTVVREVLKALNQRETRAWAAASRH